MPSLNFNRCSKVSCSKNVSSELDKTENHAMHYVGGGLKSTLIDCEMPAKCRAHEIIPIKMECLKPAKLNGVVTFSDFKSILQALGSRSMDNILGCNKLLATQISKIMKKKTDRPFQNGHNNNNNNVSSHLKTAKQIVKHNYRAVRWDKPADL